MNLDSAILEARVQGLREMLLMKVMHQSGEDHMS